MYNPRAADAPTRSAPTETGVAGGPPFTLFFLYFLFLFSFPRSWVWEWLEGLCSWLSGRRRWEWLEGLVLSGDQLLVAALGVAEGACARQRPVVVVTLAFNGGAGLFNLASFQEGLVGWVLTGEVLIFKGLEYLGHLREG
ncbi:hypothetical protein Scep_028437 [Stephania cephalantha]|uniref:Uncharacterized protein n=1 Tax=Stephania cephalantha TaxID=152367 RepID=A0AAP0HNF9_9MAGN